MDSKKQVQNAGNGNFAELSIFSFHPVKHIAAGEGGMVTTSSPDIWDSIWSFKDHGKSYEAVHRRDHPPGFRWLHERFGSNFRLTELQSAIGRIQLQRLSEWTAVRKRNALLLADYLSDIDCVRVPLPPDGFEHAWYKFYAFIQPERLLGHWSRDRILFEISSLGYPAFSGSCSEIYLERCFIDAGLSPQCRLPVARTLGETSLMFLVHPSITIDQMASYAETVRSVLKQACR